MLKKMQASKTAKPAPPKEKKIKYQDKEVVQADEEIVEVDESRDPATLVFIGHVDAGKSTISGHLMLQMGVVD